MAIRSLIINPGSTSTKIGVFDDEQLVFDKTLRHTTEEIAQFPTIFAQKDFRKKIILDALEENKIDIRKRFAHVLVVDKRIDLVGNTQYFHQLPDFWRICSSFSFPTSSTGLLSA